MRQFVAGHRAMLGIFGIAAAVGLLASLAREAAPIWLEIALGLAALLGLAAPIGSPYWKIVYRESPLRRAVTGVTDLDERELELRDRAHGLAYFLFATVNIALPAFAILLLHSERITLSPAMLVAAIIPYAAFAVTLPVILLEWFEPSGASGPDPFEEEEE